MNKIIAVERTKDFDTNSGDKVFNCALAIEENNFIYLCFYCGLSGASHHIYKIGEEFGYSAEMYARYKIPKADYKEEFFKEFAEVILKN